FIAFAPKSISTTASPWTCFAIHRRMTERKPSKSSTKRGQPENASFDAKDSLFLFFLRSDSQQPQPRNTPNTRKKAGRQWGYEQLATNRMQSPSQARILAFWRNTFRKPPNLPGIC